MDLSRYNLTPSAKKAILNAQVVADSYQHLKIIDLRQNNQVILNG